MTNLNLLCRSSLSDYFSLASGDLLIKTIDRLRKVMIIIVYVDDLFVAAGVGLLPILAPICQEIKMEDPMPMERQSDSHHYISGSGVSGKIISSCVREILGYSEQALQECGEDTDSS